LTRAGEREAQRLLELENELPQGASSRQDEAIKTIAKTIRRARSGLKDPAWPDGHVPVPRPSGVGKTLLSKALAEFMFGTRTPSCRSDMSEYMERATNVSRLIGRASGYVGYEEGGQLTERIAPAVQRRAAG